ncbi:ribonuclease Z, mitochondrial isoform X1 [Manduca sexta]|uniref:Zinc phosphodiesterase ELAC protein 2 n=2 Tax=Manduca sexta TaxID=7130 RepID=A0A922CR51_MANSE|nr:ribonuclease Z, mitochondrial isoform X1 [Manduca sexta]KAG6454773.1 hypothetical protein O3G_MSEX008848 [Manduca sexta]
MYGIGALFSKRVVSSCDGRCYSTSRNKKLFQFLAKMPKETAARIAVAQRQRQVISKKSEKYTPSTVYLQVMGSGARGAANTLYLFTDQKRYLFNCGECTQRLAHEHKVKLSRLEHVFITSKTWRNIGGLPGLSLTLQDVGIPKITLHGPEGLDELYQATRRFVIMKEMNVKMAQCSPSEDFEDNVMTVKYVLLGPHDSILPNVNQDLKPAAKKPKLDNNSDKDYEEFIHDDTDYYKPEIRNMEAKSKGASPEKSKSKSSSDKDMKKKTEKVLYDLQKKTKCTVAYICTLKKRLGTLDLAKCVERGVKPGPQLGQLKNGQDVVLPDGTLVLSKDVKTPDDPGPVFIIIEVPELSYLKVSEFAAHFDNGDNPPENIPTIIVHYTPPNVFNHPTYREFMSMFGASTRHLVLNAQNSCLGSEAVHRSQHKLHLLDADVFPLLRDASVPAEWSAPANSKHEHLKGLDELKNKIALAQFQNIINMEGSCKGDGSVASDEDPHAKLEIISARTLTMFQLRPKKQLDRSAEPKLHIQEYIEETMDIDGFVGSLEQFRRVVDGIRYKATAHQEYPKVVFLGTGSCIPSKTRNTSAIALQIDENRSMLLDCGEGTFGQLVRFFGPKKVNAFLRTLTAVYVSHLHADHHIGLIGILQARREAFEEVSAADKPDPLYLLAPGQIMSWLSVYDQRFERIRQEFTLIPNQELLYNVGKVSEELTSAVLARIGVQDVRTCLVSHCPNAFGVAVSIDSKYKLTYSGDTIPCEELVNLGKNSTLLIHEATMEDQLAEEARMKMHSTTSQAIEIGRSMHARYTVLTHFSQRYARLPRLNHNILHDNNSVGIAFDNMQISMSDLELLPHMYAPLQLLFAEHCMEMEQKAENRERKKNLTDKNPTLVEEVKHKRRCNRSPNRGSKCSSPCHDGGSAPNSYVNYRESNASRLRQELKGMTVSGIVRPRSKSSSPTKISTRSLSESATSKLRRETSPEKPCVQAAVEVIPTSRTISECSNSSRDARPADRLKLIKKNSTSHVIDTRSRTLNSAAPIPKNGEILDIVTKNIKKKASIAPSTPPSRPNSGYGKPLVTPVNRKLTVRRESPPQRQIVAHVTAEKVSPVLRSKSPVKPLKGDIKESSPSNTSKKSDINRIRQPTKAPASGNKLRGTHDTNAKLEVKLPTRSNAANKNNISSSHNKNVNIPKHEFRPGARSWNQEPVRKVSAPLQELNGKCKNFYISPSNGRPNSAIHSNKSFKPQLEDIKSSYLLLNKKSRDKTKHFSANEKPDLLCISKPEAFSEHQRREQLSEARKKFQSKQFWNDAKYDKIEGLNWISWN